MPKSNNYDTNKLIEVKNGVITGKPRTRPFWINAETGEYLTDEQFIQRENLYPLLQGPETKPNFDPFYQHCDIDEISNWNIYSDRVEATWVISDISLSNIINRKINNIAAIRYNYEVGGISFTDSSGNVLKIHTGRESQTKLGSAYTSAKEGIRTDPSKWKTLDGFVNISNSDIMDLAMKVWNFVQNCYDREEVILNMLSSCTTIDEVKTVVNNEFGSGWSSDSLINS